MTLRILLPFSGGDFIGGSHISALTVAAHLEKNRYHPHVLLHGRGGRLLDLVCDLGLEHSILRDVPMMSSAYYPSENSVGPLRYLLRTVPALRKTARQLGIDIVQTNEGRMHTNWALPAKLAGARFLWYHRQVPKARAANLIAPLLADRMLTVSRYAKPPASRLMGRRVEVVRSPFMFDAAPPDRTTHRARLLEEIAAPADAFVLGYVGALIDRKRPDDFVRVVAATAARLPGRDVRGVIFGEEEHVGSGIRDTVRQLIDELGLADRVHLLGYRSPIAGWMSALDSLVVTAVAEPFGRTLVEAMELGVPVVASDHGGNPEAIRDGETGFLAPAGDAAAFAAPLIALALHRDLHERIGRAAREEVHRRFGLDRSVVGVQRVYDALAPSRPRTPASA